MVSGVRQVPHALIATDCRDCDFKIPAEVHLSFRTSSEMSDYTMEGDASSSPQRARPVGGGDKAPPSNKSTFEE
jgi:hypothetical protein